MKPRTSTGEIDYRLSEMKESLTISQLILKAKKKFYDVDNQTVEDNINLMTHFLSLRDINILLDKLKQKDALSSLNQLLSEFDEEPKVKVAELRHILMVFIDPISRMDIKSFTQACRNFLYCNRSNTKIVALLLSSEVYQPYFEDIAAAFFILRQSNLYNKQHSDLLLKFPDQAASVTVAITSSCYLTKPNALFKFPISEAEFYNRLEKNFLEKKTSAVFAFELHEFLRKHDKEQKRACVSCGIF